MDDISLAIIEFMSRFEKLKVDEISIDEAEDDICFNVQDKFEGSLCIGLNGLKYTKDENTVEGKKKRRIQSRYQISKNYWTVILETYVPSYMRSIQ